MPATDAQTNFIQQTIENQEKHSTDYQQSMYQRIELGKIVNISSNLFWIFYIAVLILCYFLYLEPTMSYKIKLAIIAAFATYPFYIYTVEQLVWKLIMYIYALISGTVYKP
jgi:hypothetical protein